MLFFDLIVLVDISLGFLSKKQYPERLPEIIPRQEKTYSLSITNSWKRMLA